MTNQALICDLPIAEKTCSSCGNKFPISEYNVLYQRKDNGHVYRRNECFGCRKKTSSRPDQRQKSNARNAVYGKTSKGWQTKARYRFKKMYNITIEAAISLLDRQHGVCANLACSKPISFEAKSRKEKAIMDHCHATGVVRGVVCDNCNKALGHAKDSQAVLLGLAAYLRT